MTVNEAYGYLKKKLPKRDVEFAVDLSDRYVFSTVPHGHNYETDGPFFGGLVFVLKKNGAMGEFVPPMFPEYKEAKKKRMIPSEYFTGENDV